MFMKKFFKIAAVSAMVLSLAACSKSNNYPGYKGEPVAATTTSASAHTYAMGQKKGMTGVSMEGGKTGVRYQNKHVAPSHQVYYFAFNQSQMGPADTDAAKYQADYLNSHRGAKVRLEGNADDRGSREYNIALGYRRALSVKSFLLQQGVYKSQIEVVSFGKEHPAVIGENEEAYRLNRRVELVYVRE